MDFLLWIALFAAGSLFWAWILFWGGAERLEGTLLSGILLWCQAPTWSTTAIKVFAAGSWAIQAVWFVIGVFSPAVRWFSP
jgi:hypothetical protein